ncbi:MAG: putative toxin-antitoxin system toxin component, PIN family [Kiritimatiellia bacterium]|nr:putative toxin-antitoxin system toxin component, PIN family [Kiritimatiellia bacterium]
MTPSRIVVDSNVIISGFLFGGNPSGVLSSVAAGVARCFTSLPILDEVRGVLQRPKFGLSAEQALAFVDEFHLLCHVVDPCDRVHVIAEDPKDNMVLECAGAAKADVIVSGDGHLLNLRQWGSIRIVSPADFIKEISGHRVARYSVKPRRT